MDSSRIFTQEIKERASLARGSKHRVCGSKSKKCHLSTDGMTQKQWEKRNGTVNTYKLNAPMVWVEFKALPTDLQKTYLTSLVKTYGANASDLSKMLGVSRNTFHAMLKKNDFGLKFPVGHSMSKAQREDWKLFLADGDGRLCPIHPAEEMPVETEEREKPTDVFEDTKMNMTQFSLTFHGKIDTAAIANSIRQLLGGCGYGKVEVICTL